MQFLSPEEWTAVALSLRVAFWATLLALLTGQTLTFTAIGLGLWMLSGRPARSFVTFGQDEFFIG
ncbi:MAG: hypothetical protein VX228_14615, partial [Pseudomonadota bacterium]|nr:hypothetical protein [Pseudomonadota bacterium]